MVPGFCRSRAWAHNGQDTCNTHRSQPPPLATSDDQYCFEHWISDTITQHGAQGVGIFGILAIERSEHVAFPAVCYWLNCCFWRCRCCCYRFIRCEYCIFRTPRDIQRIVEIVVLRRYSRCRSSPMPSEAQRPRQIAERRPIFPERCAGHGRGVPALGSFKGLLRVLYGIL